MTDWQPISTAIKADLPILCFEPGIGIRVLAWLESFGWYLYGANSFDGPLHKQPYEPTHWMPLPIRPRGV